MYRKYLQDAKSLYTKLSKTDASIHMTAILPSINNLSGKEKEEAMGELVRANYNNIVRLVYMETSASLIRLKIAVPMLVVVNYQIEDMIESKKRKLV